MEITINQEDNLTLITLAGRLDTVAAVDFAARTEALCANPTTDITVDCGKLEYISSSGIRTFVALLKGCKGAGKTMRMENVEESVRHVFLLTGLARLFNLQ